MVLSNIFNEGLGLFSKAKQLQFYCWHFGRNLDERQSQELLDLSRDDQWDMLINKIKSHIDTSADRRQQIAKLLFDACWVHSRRQQLIQLIESGLLDINVRLDNYGRTLLHRVAYEMDSELVKLLIDHGINIRLRDYAGNTALHVAIQSYRDGTRVYRRDLFDQNIELIIRYLLEADRNLENERSHHKRMKLDSTESIRSEGSCPSRTSNHNINEQINTDKFANNSSEVQCPSKDQPSAKTDQTEPQSLEKPSATITKQRSKKQNSHKPINPLLLEDTSSTLIDTKNAFGRTALHYCVLVVGQEHLGNLVNLLITYGADTDAHDSGFRTPLYCLVKRLGVRDVRQKCRAITHLLDSGCDDLGLAINPRTFFTEKYISDMENNIVNIVRFRFDIPANTRSILGQTTYERVPSLKHLVRVHIHKEVYKSRQKLKKLKKVDEEETEEETGIEEVEEIESNRISLPRTCPAELNAYINRKILLQNEIF